MLVALLKIKHPNKAGYKFEVTTLEDPRVTCYEVKLITDTYYTIHNGQTWRIGQARHITKYKEGIVGIFHTDYITHLNTLIESIAINS